VEFTACWEREWRFIISARKCFEGGPRTTCRINHRIFEADQRGQQIELWFFATNARKVTQEATMKTAIMGTGALGGYFGACLARAGHDVTFIARGQPLQAIRENGLQVKSPNGDFVVKPAKATDDPAEVGPVELILLCVKTYDAVTAAEQMKPMVGPQTVIIPVLNGIDHIETLRAILGAEHLLGGMASLSTYVVSPAVIQHVFTFRYALEFGELAGGTSERVQALQQVLVAAGGQVVPNIAERMWWKFAVNCGYGVLCLARANLGVISSFPELMDLLAQCWREAAAVGTAKGVKFEETFIEDTLKAVRTLPAQTKPSTLLDLERGRRLEIDAFNGSVSRMGKALGVPTPVNDFVYACLKPWLNGSPAMVA
jgi:2-dehydropantoate 2-reductase